MKPPNHGMRVKVADPFLTWTGYLIYTPKTTRAIDWRTGLSLRTEFSVGPILVGDRITLLP